MTSISANWSKYLERWAVELRPLRWGQRTPGSLVPQSPHFGALPCFLMCRYRSLPPGVLMMRVLFDLVLYLCHARQYPARPMFDNIRRSVAVGTYGCLRRCCSHHVSGLKHCSVITEHSHRSIWWKAS